MEQRIEYLLRQYEKNNCSREEMEELFSFINKLRAGDPSLKKAVRNLYNDIRKNHPSFTYVDEYGNLVLTEPEDHTTNLPDKTIVSRRAKWKLLIVVITSCIVGLYALVWIVRKNLSVANYIQKPAASVPTKKYVTKAQQGHLTLSDSTEVWLNVASNVEIPDKFSDSKREIALYGEAFFSTKSAANVPFIIKCDDITITAYSKSFNIKAYPNDKHLTVNSIDGKIRINRSGELIGVLSGGQSLKLNKEDDNITRKTITAENTTAWRQGNMMYEEEFMIDIIADIQRIYNVNITLGNADFERMRVSFSFTKHTTVTEVLENLCAVTNTQLDGENGEFIIL
ncbi:MAG: FecR domain-containing protein [Agriterribacter sp.]